MQEAQVSLHTLSKWVQATGLLTGCSRFRSLLSTDVVEGIAD